MSEVSGQILNGELFDMLSECLQITFQDEQVLIVRRALVEKVPSCFQQAAFLTADGAIRCEATCGTYKSQLDAYFRSCTLCSSAWRASGNWPADCSRIQAI